MSNLKANNMINLNPIQNISDLIGNICNNLDLIRDTSISIEVDDFVQNTHKLTFASIKNIAIQSPMAKTISARDIDNYLSAFEGKHKKWLDQKGFEYTEQCIEKSNPDTFTLSYQRVKKMSLLRAYTNEGIDISDLYNYKSLDMQELDNDMVTIDNMEMRDIIDHFSVKQLRVKDRFNIDSDVEQFKAGSNLDDLFERLAKGPDYGMPFDNPYYNALFRGMKGQKLLLQSAESGGGKSRNAIRDVCTVSCSKHYNIKTRKWEEQTIKKPTLLISTELEEDEVNILMLAYISGIPQTVIQNSNYENEVANRLQIAREVLEEAPIYITVIKDFSIRDIEDIIERHVIEKDIAIAAFDYIQMRPKLQRSLNEVNGGVMQREDQVLAAMSEALKHISERYDIFIRSSTQLNNKAKEVERKGQEVLAGGRATANKIDFGIITTKASGKDIKAIEHIMSHPKWGATTPNYMHWVYKNRQNRDELIVWTDMNLGNLREEVCFITDYNYNLVEDIFPEYINYTDVETEEEENYTVEEYNDVVEF